MTIEELHEKYGFKPEEYVSTAKLHPVYERWLPACWIIQDVYAALEAGHISLGKARELTAAIIQAHLKCYCKNEDRHGETSVMCCK